MKDFELSKQIEEYLSESPEVRPFPAAAHQGIALRNWSSTQPPRWLPVGVDMDAIDRNRAMHDDFEISLGIFAQIPSLCSSEFLKGVTEDKYE